MPVRCDSAKVRAKMTEAGFTVARLSSVSGISTATINRILNNNAHNASDYTLQQIADALQCSPYDLLCDDAVEESMREETLLAVEQAAQSGETPVIHPHSVLDIPAYVESIKAASDAHLETMRHSRNAWRRVAVGLFVLLMAAIIYLAWEIFNPNNGITSILWAIYNK